MFVRNEGLCGVVDDKISADQISLFSLWACVIGIL